MLFKRGIRLWGNIINDVKVLCIKIAERKVVIKKESLNDWE